MDRATIEPAIRIVLTEIHSKLSEAARIAKAPEACALAGERRRRRDRFDGYRTTDLRGRSSARRAMLLNRLSRE
jgi:hypothetical protein